MPTVSVLAGIAIKVYVVDHPPPHIHAIHGRRSARITIETAEVLQGSLAPAEQRIVLDWVRHHRTELMAAWNTAQQGQLPPRIDD